MTTNFETAARLAKAFLYDDDGPPMFHNPDSEGKQERRSEASKDRWMRDYGLLTRGIEHALDTLDRERQPVTLPKIEPLPDVMSADELKERIRPANDGTLT